MKQKGAESSGVIPEKNTERMSEQMSKKLQDAIDGMMRNDPTMKKVDLRCEFFILILF